MAPCVGIVLNIFGKSVSRAGLSTPSLAAIFELLIAGRHDALYVPPRTGASSGDSSSDISAETNT